jgi:hypothetical protein
MRYVEIVPRNGSHYVIVDGKEWSRHDDVKIAEQVRDQILVSQLQRAKKTSIAAGRVRQYGPQAFVQTLEKGLSIERE